MPSSGGVGHAKGWAREAREDPNLAANRLRSALPFSATATTGTKESTGTYPLVKRRCRGPRSRDPSRHHLGYGQGGSIPKVLTYPAPSSHYGQAAGKINVRSVDFKARGCGHTRSQSIYMWYEE